MLLLPARGDLILLWVPITKGINCDQIVLQALYDLEAGGFSV